MKDEILFGASILGAGMFVIFLIFGGIGVTFSVLNKYECANLQDVTGRKTEFRWFGGCFVEHEGELLPYAKWKPLDVRVKERR